MDKQQDHAGTLRTMIHQREDGEPCICAECRALTAAISALTVDEAVVERAMKLFRLRGYEFSDSHTFRLDLHRAIQAAIQGESHE